MFREAVLPATQALKVPETAELLDAWLDAWFDAWLPEMLETLAAEVEADMLLAAAAKISQDVVVTTMELLETNVTCVSRTGGLVYWAEEPVMLEAMICPLERAPALAVIQLVDVAVAVTVTGTVTVTVVVA
jgi:hypothetical protein